MPSRPNPPRRTSSLKRFITYSLEAISPRSRKSPSRRASDDSTTKNTKIRTNSISYPTALIHCSSGICEGTWSDWEMCDGIVQEGGMRERLVDGRNGVTKSGVGGRLSSETVRRLSRSAGGAKDETAMKEKGGEARASSFDWIDIPPPTPPRSSIDSHASSSTHRARKWSTASSMRTITFLPFHLEGFDYSFDEFGHEWDVLGEGNDDGRGSMLVKGGCDEDEIEEELESQCFPSFLFTNADEVDDTSRTPHDPSSLHTLLTDDTTSSFLDLDDVTSTSFLPTLPFPPPPGHLITPV